MHSHERLLSSSNYFLDSTRIVQRLSRRTACIVGWESSHRPRVSLQRQCSRATPSRQRRMAVDAGRRQRCRKHAQHLRPPSPRMTSAWTHHSHSTTTASDTHQPTPHAFTCTLWRTTTKVICWEAESLAGIRQAAA